MVSPRRDLADVQQGCSSEPERLLDQAGTVFRRRSAGVDFEVVDHVPVDALKLPARQADKPVATPPLAILQDVERSKDADPAETERREQIAIRLLVIALI